MSTIQINVGEKQHKTKATSYFVGALRSIDAAKPEFFPVVTGHSSTLFQSRLGQERILRVNKDSFIDTISYNSKVIPVKEKWKLSYIKRIGKNVILGDLKTYTESGTGKIILKVEQKTDINPILKKGVTTISYKGLIEGKEAFRMDGDELNLIKIDSAIVKEKRV